MPFKDPEARRAYYRDYAKKNPEGYRRRNKDVVRRLREALDEAKDMPCLDCGVRYPPYVMDFDHVRGEKKYEVARLVTLGSMEKLLEEIKKCDVVCSNCHRERTHNMAL